MSLSPFRLPVGSQLTPRATSKAWLLLAAVALAACSGEEQGSLPELSPAGTSTAQQEIRSTNKVLILGSSVNGGLQSREALAVAQLAPTYPIDVVTPEQWKEMTASQFMAYRTIIIGDAACQSGNAAFQAAIDNRYTWGSIIDGNVALLATDPSSNGSTQLVTNGVRYVLNTAQRRTGIYIALGCAYQDAPANTDVSLLEPFGDFKIQGVPGCATSGHMFEMYSPYMSAGLTDNMLAGSGGCVARSIFTSYPNHTFTFAAVAMGSPGATMPGQQTYIDYTHHAGQQTPFTGTPYILVRGAMTLGAGCGTPNYFPGEDCDLGDGLNGLAAATNSSVTCSWSCRSSWCGDGIVDASQGEECDNGQKNGRGTDTAGTLGECSSSCKLTTRPTPPSNQPPKALCQNVTVVAESTCGAHAGIDQGSYDPDNDLVSCTQSPAGPYDVGTTTVTLNCIDQTNQSSSCTGTVTVVDSTPPTVALAGEASESLECTQGGSYEDPGASASDQCSGALPASSVVRTGSVDVATPGTYALSYVATDASGNKSEPVSRTLSVADTLAPALTLNGLANVGLECGETYADPGASASDRCAGNLTSAIQKTGAVDSKLPGLYTLRYNVEDPSHHAATEVSRVVSVKDTLAPAVTVNGPLSVAVECGGTYTDPGASASDACAGDLTSAIVRAGSVNTAAVGTYSLSYKVADPSGNATTSASVRSVSVIDTLAPTLSLIGAATQTLECGSSYTDPGATASDSCSGSLTASIVKTGSVNPAAPGSYTLGYSVADGSGNSASASRAVTVRDTLAPQLQVVAGPSTVQCNGAAYVDPGATASDACAGNITSRITTTSNLDQTHAGQYTITYRVTDNVGNTSTAARQLTVAGPCTSCIDVSLGDYNLFLLEDYNYGPDVQGKVAAGGNITMQNFSVGDRLPSTDTTNVLVAGKKLSLGNGTVYGNAFYGTGYSANQGVNYQRGGKATQGTPIDFAARFASLRSLSAQLASQTANGTYTRESWGGITLKGTNPNVNVFNVPASAFTGAAVFTINVPSGSVVLVNIRGASATFQNFGYSLIGADSRNILYNFVDTTTINASSFGFQGTILAPWARMTFNNGNWDGGLYAISLNGTAEGHHFPLNGRSVCP